MLLVLPGETSGGEKELYFFTDNAPITHIWHTGTSKSNNIMHLVCKLYLFAAQSDFSISFKYIPGKTNNIADSISRFQMERFRKLAPTAEQQPTSHPSSLVQTMYIK